MSVTTIVPGGVTGGNLLQVSGYERVVYSDLMTAFEPSKLYRIRARIKNTVRPTDSSRNKIRVGLEGLASDGQTLVDANGNNSNGDQYFVAAEYFDMQTAALDTWYEFTGYLSGQGTYVPDSTIPKNASSMHAGVAFIVPVVWVNCTDGDGTCQIDAVFIDNLTDASDTLNAYQQWADITGSGYTGSQAVAALQTDISTIANGECAGRIGKFDLDEVTVSGIGKFCTLNPDGKMRFANLTDGSAIWLPALNLDAVSGGQSFALSGSVVRNDDWSWIPGRDIYVGSWVSGSRGALTQHDLPDGVPRFKIGQALASNLLYFDPQNNFAIDLGGYAAIPTHNFGSDIPKCVKHWNSLLIVGGANGKILRSYDYGLTFTESLNIGSNYTFNDLCDYGGYLYACASHSPGFAIYRSNNGINWSQVYLGTNNQYAYDLVSFGGYLLLGLSNGTAAKVWSTTDGATWTARYVSPTESTFCRFAVQGSTAVWALIGGTTAKTIRSTDGLSWSIANTYTGFPNACAMAAYSQTGVVDWVLAAVHDGSSAAKVYANSVGTPASVSVNELTSTGDAPPGFVMLDGALYLCGGNTGGGALTKRATSSTGSTYSWTSFPHTFQVGHCRRYAVADNGYIYCLQSNATLWKIPRPHQLIT